VHLVGFIMRNLSLCTVTGTSSSHYLSSFYFVSQSLQVSRIFVSHHQEVYCIYTTGMCCAFLLIVCWCIERHGQQNIKNLMIWSHFSEKSCICNIQKLTNEIIRLTDQNLLRCDVEDILKLNIYIMTEQRNWKSVLHTCSYNAVYNSSPPSFKLKLESISLRLNLTHFWLRGRQYFVYLLQFLELLFFLKLWLQVICYLKIWSSIGKALESNFC
jgi:hypothetical protein